MWCYCTCLIHDRGKDIAHALFEDACQTTTKTVATTCLQGGSSNEQAVQQAHSAAKPAATPEATAHSGTGDAAHKGTVIPDPQDELGRVEHHSPAFAPEDTTQHAPAAGFYALVCAHKLAASSGLLPSIMFQLVTQSCP